MGIGDEFGACNVKSEEFRIRRGKKEIYGILSRPERLSGKQPAVIFSHGYGGSCAFWKSYAISLAEKGLVAFSFDFCGGSPDSRSTGSTLEMTVFTEREDLEDVISEIGSLAFVDSSNVFLAGGSLGAVVSAMAAARSPEKIRGMVLLYPAFMLCDNARRLFQSAAEIPKAYPFLGMTVGKCYFESLFSFDIFGEILPYKGNVLIIHGDADERAPISYSRRAKEEYASAELKVIPGAGHSFSEMEARQAMEWIWQYLQRELSLKE